MSDEREHSEQPSVDELLAEIDEQRDERIRRISQRADDMLDTSIPPSVRTVRAMRNRRRVIE